MRVLTVALAFFGEAQSLLYAEAMLLVDDHEREFFERQTFLKKCVRADDEPRFSRSDHFKRAPSGARRL